MNLLRLHDLDRATALALVRRARRLARGAAVRPRPGRALGLLFLDPSLRTQASMQRAAARLGLDLVQLAGSSLWNLETRDGVVMDGDAAEHLREAAPVLGAYVDLLAVRAFPRRGRVEEDFEDPVLQGFARHAGVPVLNLEGARHHPCQALADWCALEERGVDPHGTFVLSWAPHPRPLPQAVPASAACMAAWRGMRVVIQHPPGFELHPVLLEEARALAAASGGSVEVREDREALAGADAVYGKSWGSLQGWREVETHQRLAAPWRESWRIRARDLPAGAPFLHCLPVRRNVVVEDAVLDGPASAVLEQARFRLHGQTALLEHLLAPAPAEPALQP